MSAPHVAEPLIGFRAWQVTFDGRLVPWSASAAGAWEPGVNTAACLARPGLRGHVAPMRRCSCGLYALTTVRDHRLQPHVQAVGAIVAWGEVELHRTGFRAQSALVVALGVPAGCDAVHRRRLELAAVRYGVPLVALDALPAVAEEFGRAVEPGQFASDDVAAGFGGGVPMLTDQGAGGIALHHHLEVQVVSLGVRLSLTEVLAHEVIEEPRVLHIDGAVISRGDVLLHADGAGGSLTLTAPISGRVIAFRPRVVLAPLGGSGQRDRWLLDLLPDDWEADGSEVTWGRRAKPAYAAEVAAASAHSGDPFLFQRTPWREAHGHVRSAGDVLAALADLRAMPRFGSDHAFYSEVATRLRRALMSPAVARRVARMPLRVWWRVHEPDADLLLDLTGATPSVECGVCDQRADLVVYASAISAERYFSGKLDMAAALRRREVQCAAPLSAVLRAESVLKAVKPAYAALKQDAGVYPRASGTNAYSD